MISKLNFCSSVLGWMGKAVYTQRADGGIVLKKQCASPSGVTCCTAIRSANFGEEHDPKDICHFYIDVSITFFNRRENH